MKVKKRERMIRSTTNECCICVARIHVDGRSPERYFSRILGGELLGQMVV